MLPDIDRVMIGGIRYYKVPNGMQYPSITTILGDGPKPWLERWKKSLGQEASTRETNRCGNRGSAIHDMIEKYLKNDPLATNDQTVSNIQLFNKMRYSLKHVDNIVLQEQYLFSDTLHVAGTVDCIGEYCGKLSIIDFKTSTNTKTLEQVQDYFCQCVFYALAYYELTSILIEDIVIIIGVEKGLVPTIFKQKIHPHIERLSQSINKFLDRHHNGHITI